MRPPSSSWSMSTAASTADCSVANAGAPWGRLRPPVGPCGAGGIWPCASTSLSWSTPPVAAAVPAAGLRVERVPWADKWQRVTHALARAVAALARELTWSVVLHHFRLNWKTIAAVVEGVVLLGLQHRRWDAPRHRHR